MKFSFNLKGKKEGTAGYAVIKGRTQDSHLDLYTCMLQTFPEGSFYAQSPEQLQYLRQLIREAEPSFLAWMATHLREDLYLRSLSLTLSAELAVAFGDHPWVRQVMVRTVQEPIELAAWLDYYILATEPIASRRLRIPGWIRKTLAPQFNRMDVYHFTRFSPEEQARLKKALALVHPAPAGRAQRHLFDQILHDAIPAKSTWASEWEQLQQLSFDSQALQQSEFREKYKEGILSFRMGYPRLLDNLQAIVSSGVSGKVLKLAAEYIGLSAAVAVSKPSPLQLLAAYRKLKGRREGGVPMLLEALEKAAAHGSRQIGLNAADRVVVAMDVSNSMKQKLTPDAQKSCIQRYDVGPLVAYMLKDRCRSLTAGIIGNTWKPVDLNAQGILAGVDPFHRREGEAGYAINAHLVILDLLKKGKVADKLMIFTDSSLWDNRPFHQTETPDLVRAWQLYKRIAPDASLYLFDLAGYNNHRPVEPQGDGVYLISGWHDRVFEILKAMEERELVVDQANDIAS